MTKITDYASLQDVVGNYLDRKDLINEIPTFIQLCEASMNRILRSQDLLCVGQSVGWRTDVIVPLPTDYAEMRNVTLVLGMDNPDDPGQLIDGEKCQATYQPPDVIDQLSEVNPDFNPRDQVHYTFRAGNIEIWPDPGVQFRLELEYYQKVGLTDANPVNIVLLNDPDIYLYGSLIHSAPFLRDDPRLMVWSKLYDEAVGAKTGSSEKALHSGSRLTRKNAARM